MTVPELRGRAAGGRRRPAVNEIRMLDLDDVRWELDRFSKLNSATAREHDAAAPSRGWCR
jgi:hypothetical protein